jgi:hypothetical protein
VAYDLVFEKALRKPPGKTGGAVKRAGVGAIGNWFALQDE